jgi:O-methyltransferase involved in polyketide biosynthesis
LTAPRGSASISPTAHYTGYVWARNGLSHPELESLEGRLLFESLRPALAAAGVLGAPSLERFLLARHRAIDARLEAAIEDGRVSQVIEVACGLSPRGWRFARRYGDRLTYVESDLPGMAARKRHALERIGTLGEHHRVAELDVLAASGPESLPALAATLDPGRGLAIITEGLINYLPADAARQVWGLVAGTLGGFASGTYLSDLVVGDIRTPLVSAFLLLLSVFVRGRVHLHFDDAAAAERSLRASGFAYAAVAPAAPPGRPDRGNGEPVNIIEASTK